MAYPTTLTALVDPLCGWCYGAASALERLAAQPEILLRLSRRSGSSPAKAPGRWMPASPTMPGPMTNASRG